MLEFILYFVPLLILTTICHLDPKLSLDLQCTFPSFNLQFSLNKKIAVLLYLVLLLSMKPCKKQQSAESESEPCLISKLCLVEGGHEDILLCLIALVEGWTNHELVSQPIRQEKAAMCSTSLMLGLARSPISTIYKKNGKTTYSNLTQKYDKLIICINLIKENKRVLESLGGLILCIFILS